MKQKDIVLIVVIVFISAIISLFVSNEIFASPAKRQQEVENVQPISATFNTPDTTYLNSTSFDPTQPLNISQSTNSDPFNGSTSQ